MRMNVEKFYELLQLVESYISKTDTVMKAARLKLEVTLPFLASGDSFSSLALLFRIPSCTISRFLSETLQSVIFQENIGPLRPCKFRLINIVRSYSTSLIFRSL
jgi:hypothetical protein